jgi:hypothetical protein
LARALERLGRYIERFARPKGDVTTVPRLGLATTVDAYFKEALGLAHAAGLQEEFNRLFAVRPDTEGTTRAEHSPCPGSCSRRMGARAG